MKATTLLLTLWFACTGCTERQAHGSARSGEVVLARAPSPMHRLDVSFDDKVDLIGYDLDTTALVPDRAFKLTWYWRVRAPLGDGAQVFTHLADASGATRHNLDAQRALREVYPESRWRAGDFIRDEQVVTLPASWSSPSAVFYLGFYTGSRRFEVTRGPRDAEQRTEALRVPVSMGEGPAPDGPPPSIQVRRLNKPLNIDGKLDEPAWASAQTTGPMVQTLTGKAGDFLASARVLYDEQRIYIGFNVVDHELKSTFDTTDDHLWEQDCVEIMFDPDGDEKNYFELQVSPRGVRFDTRYDTRRNPRPFGHVAWDSKVQAKVVTNGTPNDAVADGGYSVELSVPFSAFAAGEPPATPPRPGARWRVNFFVMDARENGQRAVAWSPPRVRDFHTLTRFGFLEFGPK